MFCCHKTEQRFMANYIMCSAVSIYRSMHLVITVCTKVKCAGHFYIYLVVLKSQKSQVYLRYASLPQMRPAL